jgi:hypothetical protein
LKEDSVVKRTVYVPRDLERQLKEHLAAHPGQTVSGLVQEALLQRLSRPDPNKILRLAGIVARAPGRRARDRAEDDIRAGRP